jgi:DNA-binding Xre family transcriptional regulator
VVYKTPIFLLKHFTIGIVRDSDNKKFLKAIGQNVNRIRKEQNVSFQELSFRTNIEKSNLVKLTTQGSNITLLTLNKIAKGLEVPITDFFS